MPKLPNLLCIRKRSGSTGSIRAVGSIPADVALMKHAVFLVFGADMLGDAPNTPLTDNAVDVGGFAEVTVDVPV